MKIFVCKDNVRVHEIKDCEEVHISHWKNLVITYLNFETKPFSKVFNPGDWDTLIINKKLL